MFILRGLPCLGSLTHLLIGHDGSGTHPGEDQAEPAQKPCVCVGGYALRYCQTVALAGALAGTALAGTVVHAMSFQITAAVFWD